MLDAAITLLALFGAAVLLALLVSVLFGNRPLRSTDVDLPKHRARVLAMRR